MNWKIFAYRILQKIKRVMGGKITDDFDWKIYNTHYRGEMEEIKKSHTQILKQGDYVLKDDRLVKNNGDIADLHPNHRLLYETVLQLNPASVLELGCGGGDHLHNLSVLSPQTKLFGFDLSEGQLRFLRERHAELKADVRQFDCTTPFPENGPKVDVAYTQAVVMHIKSGGKHILALENLFRAATKQVVLMENWKSHDFMGDLKSLIAQGRIPWENTYFYYRESEELKRPHLMVVSSVPLNQYEMLSDYQTLSAYV